jgi:ribosome maturation factor RimP
LVRPVTGGVELWKVGVTPAFFVRDLIPGELAEEMENQQMEAGTMTTRSRGQDGATTTARLRILARETLAAMGLGLVNLTYRREGRQWILRLMIEAEGGVGLDDCSKASNQLGAVLEAEDIVPQSYILEVSSPGLDRPLFTEDDYRRFAGRRVNLRTHAPIAGRRHFQGVLQGCDDGYVALTLPSGEIVNLPFRDLASGRLEVDLDDELSRWENTGSTPADNCPSEGKVRE